MFSEKELVYIKSNRLVRLATVSNDMQPDVVPLTLIFDGQHFYCGGKTMHATHKYKNVLSNGKNAKVALVIDDDKGGIKVYGKAEIVERDDPQRENLFIKITPLVTWSWGIDTPSKPGKNIFRKTKWE